MGNIFLLNNEVAFLCFITSSKLWENMEIHTTNMHFEVSVVDLNQCAAKYVCLVVSFMADELSENNANNFPNYQYIVHIVSIV